MGNNVNYNVKDDKIKILMVMQCKFNRWLLCKFNIIYVQVKMKVEIVIKKVRKIQL